MSLIFVIENWREIGWRQTTNRILAATGVRLANNRRIRAHWKSGLATLVPVYRHLLLVASGMKIAIYELRLSGFMRGISEHSVKEGKWIKFH